MIVSALAIPAAAFAVVAGSYLAPHPLKLRSLQSLRRRCSASRQVILTYDDGPGSSFTPTLLDLLATENAKATFFLLGRRVAGHAALVDRIAGDGHEIGCHGQNHIHARKSWPWSALADIRQGYATLHNWLPANGLFRPPYGKLTLPTWLALRRRGAPLAWWTIDSGDTHRVLPQPQSVADAVARAGGGVVLMHDFDRGAERMQFVLRTTELLLQTARREGLTVCRYSDLWKMSAQSPLSNARC